jgi:hypothetical protein
MAVSDPEFDAMLEWVVRSTTNVVNKQSPTCYFTTVFLMIDEEIVAQVLVNEDTDSAADAYQVAYNFGKHIAAQLRKPDAVFVAYQLRTNGSERIMVTGYTHDGRCNAAELMVVRKGELMQVEGSYKRPYPNVPTSASQRHLAAEVMRGVIDGETQQASGSG